MRQLQRLKRDHNPLVFTPRDCKSNVISISGCWLHKRAQCLMFPLKLKDRILRKQPCTNQTHPHTIILNSRTAASPPPPPSPSSLLPPHASRDAFTALSCHLPAPERSHTPKCIVTSAQKKKRIIRVLLLRKAHPPPSPPRSSDTYLFLTRCPP